MEIEKKILKKGSLEPLFNFLNGKGNKIFAPVKKGNGIMFSPVSSYSELTWDYIQSVQSPKNVVFPKTEILFKYRTDKSAVTIEDIDEDQYPETVLWGIHPCDAAGLGELNEVFTTGYTDIQFQGRFKKLTVIGLSCHEADEYCFCTSVSVKPDDKKGSDILLTKLKSGDYLAEIITGKGKNMVSQTTGIFEEVTTGYETMVTDIPVKFNSGQVTRFLSKNFENPFWVENSLRCIGCGTCAFVCPVCTCYDIQDETKGQEGQRVRCWDSCGIGLFTLHTSGHNPREVQSQRWRQRVMHKFSYIPDTRQVLGCVGCGRCSRACPSDMNIADQLLELSSMKEKNTMIEQQV